MRGIRKRLAVGCLLALPPALGCGGAGYELAPVRGQVTCQGEPVPGGTVIFTPVPVSGGSEMPAPPAVALVDENGNFELHTDSRKGAMVGDHRVSFSVPDVEPEEDFDPSQSDDPAEAIAEMAEREVERELALKLAKIPCRRPSNPQVTVDAGENVINLELSLHDDD